MNSFKLVLLIFAQMGQSPYQDMQTDSPVDVPKVAVGAPERMTEPALDRGESTDLEVIQEQGPVSPENQSSSPSATKPKKKRKAPVRSPFSKRKRSQKPRAPRTSTDVS